MIRPFWTEPPHPELDNVTVLICQNQTPDLIRLCLESLLTFYPTIKILIVTSDVEDEAYRYIKYKEARSENIKVWIRVGDNSHGGGMHDAIISHINTRYFLTLDSDTIIKRGGWIEEIIREFIVGTFHKVEIPSPHYEPGNILAIGTLHLVTRLNDAVGNPKDDADAMKYAHPSCSMWDRELYLKLCAEGETITDSKNITCRPQFSNHGAPCWSIMKAAEKYGFEVCGFPVEDYVMHLSGASWVEPRTVWNNDFNVFVRPLVTFLTDGILVEQTDKDYDIVQMGNEVKGSFVSFNKDSSNPIPYAINNKLFGQRLRVTGDYVCVVHFGAALAMYDNIPHDLVSRLRQQVTDWPDRLEIEIDGFKFYTREYFQSKIAWL
jgi:hypothetical protein